MIRWILKKVFGLLVLVLVLLAGSLVLANVLGGGAYTVLSGSMEPTYHVGSLIYVRHVDTEKLHVGDVITFAVSEDVTVTHRIVKVIEEEDSTSFVTRGDANDTDDAKPVEEENVLGKPLFSIPYAGYVVTHIRKPLGLFFDI